MRRTISPPLNRRVEQRRSMNAFKEHNYDRMPTAIALWFPLWTAARSTGNDYFDAASTDGGANGLLKNLISGLHQ